MKGQYQPNSISLIGGISMGTGVMIGAGIFALTGQIAQLAGPWFPLSFLAGAVVTGFSAYTYVKMSNAYPSAGGIAMILQKAYGPGAIAGALSLLMAFSMVISESLVARTFGSYLLRLFGAGDDSFLVPTLGVTLILTAYAVNVSGNRSVGFFSFLMAMIKVGGIALFGLAALWAGGFDFQPGAGSTEVPVAGFMASVALSILAFKGFTTITNSGAEIVDPHRNVGRAIVLSIAVCTVLYLLVALAVGASLSMEEIVAARDYSLARAAEPAFGAYGVYFTVAIAIVATASGVLASIFAVSRMLAMLTEMGLVPHRHFGMPGPIQAHTLVYTVVTASVLTVLFDLGRIAALGAFFYLVMDMLIHWGVWRRLRNEIGARGWVLLAAIALDALVLGAFTLVKLRSDPWIVAISIICILAVLGFERVYLTGWTSGDRGRNDH